MWQNDTSLRAHMSYPLHFSFKVWAILQMLMLILCIAFTAELTMRNPHRSHANTTTPSTEPKLKTFFPGPRTNFGDYTLGFTQVFLTVDVLLRFFSSPLKRQFFQSVMNWIDILLCTVSSAALVIMDNSNYFLHVQWLSLILPLSSMILMLLRLFRIAQLSLGVRVLLLTLKASLRELFTLIAFLNIGTAIFGFLVYSAERLDPDTQFEDATDGFWWAAITMTTVGYGDLIPRTFIGRSVAVSCIIAGLVLTSLCIPIVSGNFLFYYQNAKALAKWKSLKKKYT